MFKVCSASSQAVFKIPDVFPFRKHLAYCKFIHLLVNWSVTVMAKEADCAALLACAGVG